MAGKKTAKVALDIALALVLVAVMATALVHFIREGFVAAKKSKERS